MFFYTQFNPWLVHYCAENFQEQLRWPCSNLVKSSLYLKLDYVGRLGIPIIRHFIKLGCLALMSIFMSILIKFMFRKIKLATLKSEHGEWRRWLWPSFGNGSIKPLSGLIPPNKSSRIRSYDFYCLMAQVGCFRSKSRLFISDTWSRLFLM
jgi:hypothetical protein